MAVKHTNGLGQTRWQPRLKNGQVAFEGYYGGVIWGPENWNPSTAVLLRSERRADRVAAREGRRIERNKWTKEET